MTTTTQPIQGGKFLTEADKKAQAQEQKQAEFKRRQDKVLTIAGLILCDGAMMAMILNDLIHNVIGMLFLIGISVFFGGRMK